ncbi:MAG: AraC family transcriptional regulator, partial [Ruminococcus sp.]|nr:AraC family transcriptional regulator [Ruminococcus sp.]
MNLATGIQKAIDYIEEHITDELDLADIAKQATCSPYYFQKIFGILCGITVGEYIRNRRLTLAGSELKKPNVKVIDTALRYGYESPESFTRAFTRFHGLTPTEAKREGGRLRSFSRFKVQIILKGGNSMNYNIVKKDAFTVLEKVEQHTVAGEQNVNSIPEFWGRAQSDGTITTLLEHASDHTYIYGTCYGNGHSNTETFDYGIA